MKAFSRVRCSLIRRPMSRRCSTNSRSGEPGSTSSKWSLKTPHLRPRSWAEFFGLVLGASIFPLSVTLMNWWDSANTAPPQLAEELRIVPKHALGGPFRLRESRTGSYMTDEEIFNSHWTLLYFGFSKCAEVCPNTLSFLRQLMERCNTLYGGDEETAEGVRTLQAAFLSIDFIRDSPDVVEKFVQRYNLASGERPVRGLCGTSAEVQQAAKVWHVYYSSVDETDDERAEREAKGVPAPVVDDTYQFDHSSAIYLVGPDGKMKDFFFKEMGIDNAVERLGVHFSDVYGFSDTREKQSK